MNVTSRRYSTNPSLRLRGYRPAVSFTQVTVHTLLRTPAGRFGRTSNVAPRAPHRTAPAVRPASMDRHDGTWHEIFANHRVRKHVALAAQDPYGRGPIGPQKKERKARGAAAAGRWQAGQAPWRAKATADRIHAYSYLANAAWLS